MRIYVLNVKSFHIKDGQSTTNSHLSAVQPYPQSLPSTHVKRVPGIHTIVDRARGGHGTQSHCRMQRESMHAIRVPGRHLPPGP